MKLLTDEELVRAVQEGNILAFEDLVKRYQHGLYVFVMRFVRDEAAAFDIVQNTLTKVYEVIDRVDPEKKFSTFVFEIAKNFSISQLRRKNKLVSIEEIVDMGEEESFVEDLYRSDMARVVHDAVQTLPVHFRRVISLYYFEELSYEEIGKKIHIPVNTVRTHLKRGKNVLKKLLQQYENN